MKKLFFSALAIVAFAGSAFASNETLDNIDVCEANLSKIGICKVWVDLYDQKGNYLGTEYFWTATASSAACTIWAENKKNEVVAQKNRELRAS